MEKLFPVEIIFNQILILAIIALVGVIASASGVVSKLSNDFLAKIIFNVTLPSMLLTNFSRLDVTPRLVINSIEVLVLSFFALFFMYIVGIVTIRLLRMNSDNIPVFKLHSMMGNIIYLGFPVISSLFGQEGLLYASLFTISSNLIMWTAGVTIITNKPKIKIVDRLKHILNPNTIAILTGFTLFLLNIKFPGIILNSIGGIGSTNTYLSMLYIGSVLWYARGNNFLKNKNIYILSANRLLIVPFLLTVIFSLSGMLLPIHFDKIPLSVIIIESAMPCMVNVVILIRRFGFDNSSAVANVFVSTIFSILTLPLIFICIEYFL